VTFDLEFLHLRTGTILYSPGIEDEGERSKLNFKTQGQRSK